MEKLWDKIKKSVLDGVTTAAEKTEEYTKIGKAKLDILAVKHKITRQFTELGGLVYDAVKDNKSESALASDEVAAVIKRLNELDEELAKRENEMDMLLKKDKNEAASSKKN